MKKSIIVFGGSGFIGTHLLKKLSQTTDDQIVSVDIKEPKSKVEGVNYVHADVRDLKDFDVAGEISEIYNFAAVHTTPGHETHEYYETNIRGATEVTAFARRKNIKKIVFTSSISVYGPSEEMKTEKSEPKPESAYGWSKWSAEGIHSSWLGEGDENRLIMVRPAVVFGNGEGGNFTRLASLLKRGFFPYAGRRDTIKSCIYVEDLLEAIEFARNKKEREIVFNGCYQDRYMLSEIVETFKADHFPSATTFLVPRFLLMTAARVLQPLSLFGLGIHPDRVTKLVRSTDIYPGWLESQGRSEKGKLPSALKRWSIEYGGQRWS